MEPTEPPKPEKNQIPRQEKKEERRLKMVRTRLLTLRNDREFIDEAKKLLDENRTNLDLILRVGMEFCRKKDYPLLYKDLIKLKNYLPRYRGDEPSKAVDFLIGKPPTEDNEPT